jgi:hypothetical protein
MELLRRSIAADTLRWLVENEPMQTARKKGESSRGKFSLGARPARPVTFAGNSLLCARLQHDPEKWIPVFGKDHA